ncbi:hypothetical protein MIR68_006602 [Amoeboaphelidium protococcarum]|nr:hypothetical protein MIR68_006602 [Amoeboaphelidium protococcarum]
MSLKKRARPATSEEESSVQSSHNFSDDNNDNDTHVQMGSSAHGKGASDDIRKKYADYKVHLSLKSQPNVPAFLIKLYNMVNDKGCDDMIQWSPDGMSFIVLNQEDFSQYVLPKFFKHNNFSSFVRQLNMYGFHKVVDVLQGVKQDQSSTERQEFKQDFFQRDNPKLMEQMKRKAAVKSAQAKLENAIQLLAGSGSGGNSIVGTSGGGGTGNNMLSTLNASDVGIIIQEINAIKQTQLAITQEMQNISQQNEIIWKEMMQQQQRHQQQELVVNNIVRFLAQLAKLDKSGTLKGRVEQQFSQLLQHATQSSPGGVKQPYLIGDSQSLDDNDVYSNDGDNFALNESTNALMQSLSSQQQSQQPSIQQIPSPSDTSPSSSRGQQGQQLTMSPMNPSAYKPQQQQFQQPSLQMNPSKLLTQVPYNQSHINDISSDLEILNDNINDVTGALGYDLDQFSSIEDFLNEIQTDNKQQQQ